MRLLGDKTLGRAPSRIGSLKRVDAERGPGGALVLVPRKCCSTGSGAMQRMTAWSSNAKAAAASNRRSTPLGA
jgi:hypothetical protein